MIGLTALAVLAMSATATARPVTFTQVETFSETFSDEPFLCQDELYMTTATARVVTHLTAATDENGDITFPLHFHEFGNATIVSVPLDGTGVSYTARYHFTDSENIRSVKHGTLAVETDTDHQHTVAHGSDGSHVSFLEYHHFTINANGDVAVEFEKVRAVC